MLARSTWGGARACRRRDGEDAAPSRCALRRSASREYSRGCRRHRSPAMPRAGGRLPPNYKARAERGTRRPRTARSGIASAASPPPFRRQERLNHEGTKIRRYEDTKIRRYEDTKIRRYEDTKIRRYKDTKIRKKED